MKNDFTVTVTGTWDIDVEADTAEQAEQLLDPIDACIVPAEQLK